MVLLIFTPSFVFGLLKLSSIIRGVWTECETSDFCALLPSPVAALILRSISKTSWRYSLILTWNNSFQIIFSLMSFFFFFFHAQNHVCFLNQPILLERTILNCGNEWIDYAATVTQSWNCFRIATIWKKTESQYYFYLVLRESPASLLKAWLFSQAAQSARVAMTGVCSQGWRVFLQVPHHFPEWTQEIMVTVKFRNALVALCSSMLWLLWFFRT